MCLNIKSDINHKDPLQNVFDVIDSFVEHYLASIIKPFLVWHERFYSKLNFELRSLLDSQSERIPDWFTANFITYLRTAMIIPCLMLLVQGYLYLPALVVMVVDFGDFLDGVVARYWVDVKNQRRKKFGMKKDILSDEPGFDHLVTGNSSILNSWITNQRNRSYGGFVDAVCDKAFVVPCWIYLLSTVPSSSGLDWLQYFVLWCLILAESASGAIRFRAYFSSGATATPSVQGLNFSSSAVKADHIGKAKQTFEMVGTTLFILPSVVRYIGLLLLTAAVPLAYESVRRKINRRVIYVDGTVDNLDHNILKFWTQAKGMGSKLFVGISEGENSREMIQNACSVEKVDAVITRAPAKVTPGFMAKYGIDFVVYKAGQPQNATSDVLSLKKCLLISEDGKFAKVLESKETKTN